MLGRENYFFASRRLDILLPDNQALVPAQPRPPQMTGSRRSEAGRGATFATWMQSFEDEAPLNLGDVQPTFYVARSQLSEAEISNSDTMELSQTVVCEPPGPSWSSQP